MAITFQLAIRDRNLSSEISAQNTIETTVNIPPQTPLIILPKISIHAFCAAARMPNPQTKIVMEIIDTNFRPNLSAKKPARKQPGIAANYKTIKIKYYLKSNLTFFCI